jgi:hypothetical protein
LIFDLTLGSSLESSD